jgi:hypothetical protein
MAVNDATSRVGRCHGSLFSIAFGGHDASHRENKPQFIALLISYEVERLNPIRELETSRARARSAYPQGKPGAEGCDVESCIAL